MNSSRHWYILGSFTLSLLAVIFCSLVFRSGQLEETQIGSFFLTGIPNYYFFYTIILPFIGAGVTYLAFENKYIRFFGEISSDLDADTRGRVQRFRRILLVVALIFSVLVIIQDAADKSTALPPYSIDLNPEQKVQVTNYFACQKGWITGCGIVEDPENQIEGYLKVLKDNGFKGEKTSGFESFSHWSQQSTLVYKLESFLSFLAVVIISLLLAEIFLFMMVKNHVKQATKNLVIWMAVLASLWFPTKMYSSWSSNLGVFSPPAILWFGIAVLMLGVMLIIFLKTERNDLYKFANIITAIFSALIAGVSLVKPEIIQTGIEILRNAGWIYTAIFSMMLMFSLYLVTDHFMSNYELESSK